MSVPTWPLRSRWALIARAHLQQRLKLPLHTRRLTLTAQTRYGASLTFRDSHSFVDPADATPKTTREFPINIIDGENSIRRFSKLVETREAEEARNIMADFVSSYAANGNMELFRQLQRIIMQQKDPDISLLVELGTLLASAGRLAFVKTEIRPVVAELRSDSLLSQFDAFLGELSQTDSPAQRSTNVFEEASGDYTDVMLESPSPSLSKISIMDLVQNNLPAILPEPRANDASIFEDQSTEYALNARITAAKLSTGTDLLIRLLRDNLYDRAYQLLKEMKTLGTTISFSQDFEYTAVYALNYTQLSATEKAEHFLDWLSLVPNRDLTTQRELFERVRYALLQSTVVDVSLVKRSLILFATKGYHRMAGRFLPVIIRYSTFEEITATMQDFEDAIREYWLGVDPDIVDDMGNRAARDLRRIAVRFLAYGGRLQDAMSLLPDPTDKDIYVTAYTYQVLLTGLRQTRVASLRRAIPLVQEQLEARYGPNAESLLEGLSKALSTVHLEIPADPENLPLMLRYLRKALISEPTRLNPHTIANFMQTYIAMTGRTYALKVLFRKALRSSFASTAAFLLAEMQYYRRHSRYDLIVKTFVEHFYLEGVPREEVERSYARIRELDEKHPSTSQEDNPYRRLTGFDSASLLPLGRAWPVKEHTALVWDALVAAARNDPKQVEHLYNCLLDIGLQGADHGTAPSVSSVAALQQPSRRRTNISPAAFMAFLRSMLNIKGPRFGHQFLNDMHQLRFIPTEHHYAELVHFWARGGHRSLVFALLDDLDAGGGKVVKVQEPRLTIGPDGELERGTYQKKLQLLRPDTFVYISALRGFIQQQDVVSAEEICRRMDKVAPMPPGVNARLDQAMLELQRLKDRPPIFDGRLFF